MVEIKGINKEIHQLQQSSILCNENLLKEVAYNSKRTITTGDIDETAK